nr:uncharacterized protein LOC109173053 [Ipomoea batatas]
MKRLPMGDGGNPVLVVSGRLQNLKALVKQKRIRRNGGIAICGINFKYERNAPPNFMFICGLYWAYLRNVILKRAHVDDHRDSTNSTPLRRLFGPGLRAHNRGPSPVNGLQEETNGGHRIWSRVCPHQQRDGEAGESYHCTGGEGAILVLKPAKRKLQYTTIVAVARILGTHPMAFVPGMHVVLAGCLGLHRTASKCISDLWYLGLVGCVAYSTSTGVWFWSYLDAVEGLGPLSSLRLGFVVGSFHVGTTRLEH